MIVPTRFQAESRASDRPGFYVGEGPARPTGFLLGQNGRSSGPAGIQPKNYAPLVV